MSEVAKSNKLHLALFGLMVVLLVAVSCLGTAVFFLSKESTSAPENLVYAPVEAQPIPEVGFVAGQPSSSIDDTIDPNDLVIPPGVTPDDARLILASELKKMPGVHVGEGNEEIMVLFDPLCKECHTLYAKLIHGYSKKYNLKAKFIPTLIFDGNQLSRKLSLYLNDLILSDDLKGASDYLATIMSLTPGTMKEDWQPSSKADYFFNRSTIATYQIIMGHPRAGTPIFIFKNKNTGKIGILTGQPLDEDYAEMTGL